MKKIKTVSLFTLCMVMFINLSLIQVDAKPITLSLNKTKTTIYVGETTNLKVNNTNKVKWSSSKKAIASVTKEGKVTGIKKGVTNIIAKFGNKSLTCKVTVKTPTLNKDKVTLSKGKSFTLKLNGAKTKSWTSSNTKVATINSIGKIFAKKTGTSIITSKAVDGKSYKCTVTVKEDDSTSKNSIQVKLEKALREKGLITFTEELQNLWNAGEFSESGLTLEELMADGPTFGAGWFIGYSTSDGNVDDIVACYTAYGYSAYYIEYLGQESDGQHKFKCYY